MEMIGRAFYHGFGEVDSCLVADQFPHSIILRARITLDMIRLRDVKYFLVEDVSISRGTSRS